MTVSAQPITYWDPELSSLHQKPRPRLIRLAGDLQLDGETVGELRKMKGKWRQVKRRVSPYR